jgi:hypothetical protein
LNQLNKTEQAIYNCYLKHSRNGLPYQPRKDFSDISSENVVLIKRMYNFFRKFSHIKWDDFFGAPRGLHPDEKCPPLKFFTTRAAIRAYSLYQQQLEDQSPEKQFDKIKESLRFIAMFCIKNRIHLDQYLSFKIGRMPIWTQHYREHLINPYSIMELNGSTNILNMSEDEQAIWAPNLSNTINAIRTRYHNSPKAKSLIREATKKIKIFIIEELKNIKTPYNIKQTTENQTKQTYEIQH